jgi:putative toxin-antitoxin system antitoxin component (TIGR02293 family)
MAKRTKRPEGSTTLGSHVRTLSSGKFVSRVRARKSGFIITFRKFVAKDTPAAIKIEAIRSGITAEIVDDMVRYFDVSKSDIFHVLLTPSSTAHRLVKTNRPLDPAASERVVRVADVTRIAEETFGGHEEAARWLKTPNVALDNATPLSMLDTEPGAGEVRRVLSAINYGGAL